jgi:hypothetical protein
MDTAWTNAAGADAMDNDEDDFFFFFVTDSINACISSSVDAFQL